MIAAEGLPVQLATRVLGVAESGYYEWRGRVPSARAVRHAGLTGTRANAQTMRSIKLSRSGNLSRSGRCNWRSSHRLASTSYAYRLGTPRRHASHHPIRGRAHTLNEHVDSQQCAANAPRHCGNVDVTQLPAQASVACSQSQTASRMIG